MNPRGYLFNKVKSVGDKSGEFVSLHPAASEVLSGMGTS
jgi:hypothetical protein